MHIVLATVQLELEHNASVTTRDMTNGFLSGALSRNRFHVNVVSTFF